MSQMMKMVCSKFKSHFTRTVSDRCEKEPVDCLDDKSNVDKEYMEAFRTKSYIDIWNKVQSQLGRRSLQRLASSSSLSLLAHISNYLPQETLIDTIEGSDLHPLLIDYFAASFEVYNTCELLLRSVHQAHANYRIIKRVIKLSKRTHACTDYTDFQCHAILEEFASFAMLRNPLLIISPAQFRDIHDSHGWLLHRLTMKLRKVRRRAKFTRYFKKTKGYGFVVCYRAVSSVERLCAQLEVAEKGVYVTIKDLDTMSRLVRRLQDEIEHNKAIAEMCVTNGMREVMKEVVREFQINQRCFLDQLEELEKHIYLCFLNMDRSRNLVIKQIMIQQEEYG